MSRIFTNERLANEEISRFQSHCCLITDEKRLNN